MRTPLRLPAVLLTASFVVSAAVVTNAGPLAARDTRAAYTSDGYLSTAEQYSHWKETVYAPDPAFDSSTGANSVVYSIAVDDDGKVLAVGEFNAVNGTAAGKVVRLNPDGSTDPTFDTGTGLQGAPYDVAIDADGKILVGGVFRAYNGTAAGGVVRLNPDGSLDSTFDTGTGIANDGLTSASVRSVALAPDGKIVLGGQFSSFNGRPARSVVRLNVDGSVDPTLIAGSGVSSGTTDLVSAAAVDADGRILLGGLFSGFNGVPAGNLVRLNVDGSVDTGFSPDDRGRLSGLFLDPDGKIFPLGSGALVRLNPDGSPDSAFDTGAGTDESAWDAAVNTDGTTLVVGSFTTFNGAPAGHVVRLNPDGSTDPTFSAGTGTDSDIRSVALDPEGRIVIGGFFTTSNEIPANHVARLTLQTVPH